MYSQLPISRQETSLQIMYGRGGGGVLNKVYTGSLPHDVQCLTLLHTILTEKVPLSYIPSIDNYKITTIVRSL